MASLPYGSKWVRNVARREVVFGIGPGVLVNLSAMLLSGQVSEISGVLWSECGIDSLCGDGCSHNAAWLTVA